LRILVDRLELSGKRRLLVGALAYRRRALPIWWCIQRQTGATGAEPQASFLEELAELMPPEAEAVLIGDGEFHSVDLLERARREGWSHCTGCMRTPAYELSESAPTKELANWAYFRRDSGSEQFQKAARWVVNLRARHEGRDSPISGE
jgi:hypothetical protein